MKNPLRIRLMTCPWVAAFLVCACAALPAAPLPDISSLHPDPTESNDLAAEMPEHTTKLHKQLKDWVTENVAPRYWPQREEYVTAEEVDKPFPIRDLR